MRYKVIQGGFFPGENNALSNLISPSVPPFPTCPDIPCRGLWPSAPLRSRMRDDFALKGHGRPPAPTSDVGAFSHCNMSKNLIACLAARYKTMDIAVLPKTARRRGAPKEHILHGSATEKQQSRRPFLTKPFGLRSFGLLSCRFSLLCIQTQNSSRQQCS